MQALCESLLIEGMGRESRSDRQNGGAGVGAHWEPRRVYFVGDVVTDDATPLGTDGETPPTPPGRFRALVDHYSGLLGPRFLEVDQPGVWERIESL